MNGIYDVDNAAIFSIKTPQRLYGFKYMGEAFFIHDFASRRIPLLHVWLHRWGERDQVLHPVPPETLVLQATTRQPFVNPQILVEKPKKNRAAKKTLKQQDNIVMEQLKTFDPTGQYKDVVPTPAHMRAIIAYGYTNDLRYMQDQYGFKDAMAVITFFFTTDTVDIVLGDPATRYQSEWHLRPRRSPASLILECLYRMNIDLVHFLVQLCLMLCALVIIVGFFWFFNLVPPTEAIREWINTTYMATMNPPKSLADGKITMEEEPRKPASWSNVRRDVLYALEKWGSPPDAVKDGIVEADGNTIKSRRDHFNIITWLADVIRNLYRLFLFPLQALIDFVFPPWRPV
jgi:hypothetical protein